MLTPDSDVDGFDRFAIDAPWQLWFNQGPRIVTYLVAVFALSTPFYIVSIVANFAWLPYYPVWSIIMITMGGFVIWALTVHGRDIEAA